MTAIGFDGLAGGIAIVTACSRRAQRRAGRWFRSKTSVRQGPASAAAAAQQPVEQQQEVPEISPDMAIIKDAYNVIVANQHLKLSMLQLQCVANLGGDSEAMKRLVQLMRESQVKSLRQEFLLARLIDELGALGAMWRGMREALELGEVDKEVFMKQLGLDSLMQCLQDFDGDLDVNFEKEAEAFAQQLRDFSNVAGVEKLVDEMEKAQAAVQEKKRELEELDKQLLCLWGLTLADAAMQLTVAIRKLNLARVNSSTALSSLAFSFLGLPNELGMEVPCLFEVEAAKPKLESIEQREKGQREKGLLHSRAELKAFEEEQRSNYCKHRKALLAHLQKVDAVNASHYREVCNAAAIYAHQRDRPGSFQALLSALIKGIKAYHLVLRQLSALPHEKQLQRVRELSEGDSWVTVAPQVGYFYKMASPLGDLLCMDAPSKEAIPQLVEALPRMAQLHSPATEVVEAKLADSAKASRPVTAHQDVTDEDEDIPL